MNAPVLGVLRQQQPERRLTNFMEFDAGKVQGLARVNGRHLEILAVLSKQAGCGNFRKFVEDCKGHYASVRFWALMNPELEKALTRYGFYGGFDTDEFGEIVDVMDWTRV